jgi:WD40 repeat protein
MLLVIVSCETGCGDAVSEIELNGLARDAGRVGNSMVFAVAGGPSSRTITVWQVLPDIKMVREVGIPKTADYATMLNGTVAAWADQGLGAEYAVVVTDTETGDVACKERFRSGEDATWYWCEALATDENGKFVAWLEQYFLADHFVFRVLDVEKKTLICDMSIPIPYEYFSLAGAKIAFSPNGTRVAFSSYGGGGAVGMIDLAAKKVLFCTEKNRTPYDICFHRDGKTIFTSSIDGYVTQYDGETGAVAGEFGPLTFRTAGGLPHLPAVNAQARLSALDVSPDGNYLAVDADAPIGVVVFEVATRNELSRIQASEYPVERCLFFSADSKGFWVAGSQDHQLKYFKVAD